MDAAVSRLLIPPFARMNHIATEDYILDDIHCFNDFFCRPIRPEKRPFPPEKGALVSPCDGLLRVYDIREDLVLPVKQSAFSIRRLLRSRGLARQFEGGLCLVFRLCVNHYHRYVYFDDGRQGQNRRINGLYHTVQPIALEGYPVFAENTREYTVLDTDHFGRAVQMEVGALLVGRIVNDKPYPHRVKRGEEKGHFEYGGSTIILLLQEGRVRLREDLRQAVNQTREIPVKMGEKIGDQG